MERNKAGQESGRAVDAILCRVSGKGISGHVPFEQGPEERGQASELGQALSWVRGAEKEGLQALS